jgi:hypothetical protein
VSIIVLAAGIERSGRQVGEFAHVASVLVAHRDATAYERGDGCLRGRSRRRYSP